MKVHQVVYELIRVDPPSWEQCSLCSGEDEGCLYDGVNRRSSALWIVETLGAQDII